MPRLDAAVEDADADAFPGRAAERPVARDLLRPVDSDRDALARSGGQAPGRKVRRLLAHARIVGARATDPPRGGAARRRRAAAARHPRPRAPAPGRRAL